MDYEQAVNQMTSMMLLGAGAIIGAICATIGMILCVTLVRWAVKVVGAVNEYRELRKEQEESAALKRENTAE